MTGHAAAPTFGVLLAARSERPSRRPSPYVADMQCKSSASATGVRRE